MEQEKKTVTLKQAIEIALRELSGVTFPISLMSALPLDQFLQLKQQVADPIEAAKANLVECINAIETVEARVQSGESIPGVQILEEPAGEQIEEAPAEEQGETE